MSNAAQGCLASLLPCRKGSSTLGCGWDGAGGVRGGVFVEVLDKAVSDCAVSSVQKLLSWKELGSNYNISRHQTVRNRATKSSFCGCYKVTLLFHKLIKLHLNSYYFCVLIVWKAFPEPGD